MFPVAAEELERHASITLNASKSGILLAPGVSDPALDRLPEGSSLSYKDRTRFLLIGTDRHKVQLKRDGLVVVGAAVGTDECVSEHIMGVVRCATRKLDALSLVDAQSALLLLSGCLAQALSYHLQVTLPTLLPQPLPGMPPWTPLGPAFCVTPLSGASQLSGPPCRRCPTPRRACP